MTKTIPRVLIKLPKGAEEYELEVALLTNKMARSVASIRSRTRGRLGEVMASSLFPMDVRDQVQLDRMVFDTPHGQRRIDNYLPETRQAVESKYVRITASARTKKQILKDAYLLKEGAVSEVIWVLFYGGSSRVMQMLKDNNIQVVDCWDVLSLEAKKSSDDLTRVIKIRV